MFDKKTPRFDKIFGSFKDNRTSIQKSIDRIKDLADEINDIPTRFKDADEEDDE